MEKYIYVLKIVYCRDGGFKVATFSCRELHKCFEMLHEEKETSDEFSSFCLYPVDIKRLTARLENAEVNHEIPHLDKEVYVSVVKRPVPYDVWNGCSDPTLHIECYTGRESFKCGKETDKLSRETVIDFLSEISHEAQRVINKRVRGVVELKHWADTDAEEKEIYRSVVDDMFDEAAAISKGVGKELYLKWQSQLKEKNAESLINVSSYENQPRIDRLRMSLFHVLCGLCAELTE